MPNDPFYTSAAWRAFRARTIRLRPVCQVPGCGARSSHVDHVVSRRRGGADLDEANVQAFCRSHHSQKTARVDQPGRRRSAEPLRAHGCDGAGRPFDPDHPWNRGR